MADEPHPKRPRGRPRVLDAGSSLTVWVRGSTHDAIVRVAEKHQVSVSTVVRRVLERRLSGDPEQ